MAVSIEVSVNQADMARITKRLEKVADPIKFQTIMQRAVERGLKHTHRAVEASIQSRVYARQSPFPNKPRTGRLKKDFRTFPKVESIDVLGIVESNVPYALAHELGATIRPKTAKALTIPISPLSVGRRASDFPTRFARKGVIFIPGSTGGATPLFLLKKQVTIKKKQPFELGTRESLPKYTEEIRNTIDDMV